MKNENPKAYEKLHLKLFSIPVRVFVVSLIVVSTMYIVLVAAPIIGIHINVLYEPWLLVIFIPEIVLGVLILMAKNIARNNSMSIMTIIRTKTHNRPLSRSLDKQMLRICPSLMLIVSRLNFYEKLVLKKPW